MPSSSLSPHLLFLVSLSKRGLARINKNCKSPKTTQQWQRQQRRCYNDVHTKGYQAMGSFHSKDVDTLMLQSEADYTRPSLPFEAVSHNDDDDEKEESSDFLLDRKRWTFLNHGAFGAALKVGYYRAQDWRLHLERQPLRYFDRDLLPHLVYSARRLADFCRAPREATTLIPNVTYGLNTILRGYARRQFETRQSSHIVLWDTSYGSLKKMAHQLCDRVTEIPVSTYFDKIEQFNNPGDIFQAALVDTLQNIPIMETMEENALLILDHTTSNTAINMPLESLSKFAKEHYNMLVMVDGAHGLLAQPVELSSVALPDVDFYVGNGHKWLSCPRGIGMLYCPNSEFRDTILEEPAVMSHGLGQGFQSRFLWDGCRDYAAALSVPAVLDYWQAQEGGVVQVQRDIQSNLQAAVKLLAREWHGQTGSKEGQVTLVPLELHAPMMALVRLPNSLQRHHGAATSQDAKAIQDYLFDQFIEVPIKCINGVLYVRISSHVYNHQLEEYDRLAKAILNCGKLQ